jgi:hypothetical protein
MTDPPTDAEIVAAALAQMMPGAPYTTSVLLQGIGLGSEYTQTLDGLLRAQTNVRRGGVAWYKD